MRSCWNEQATRRFDKNTLVMNAAPRDNGLHFSGHSWLHARSWLTHRWLDLASEAHTAAVVIISPSSRLSRTKKAADTFQSGCQKVFHRLFPVETAEEQHCRGYSPVRLFLWILSESFRHLYWWYSTASHCVKGQIQHFPNGWQPKPSRRGDPHFPEEKQQQQQHFCIFTHTECVSMVKNDRAPGVHLTPWCDTWLQKWAQLYRLLDKVLNIKKTDQLFALILLCVLLSAGQWQ